jgi:hypothetical protein
LSKITEKTHNVVWNAFLNWLFGDFYYMNFIVNVCAIFNYLCHFLT